MLTLDLLATFAFALVGAGGLVVIVTRLVSIRFDLHLPKFEKN
jgi:uncharacterized membrane protein YeiH